MSGIDFKGVARQGPGAQLPHTPWILENIEKRKIQKFHATLRREHRTLLLDLNRKNILLPPSPSDFILVTPLIDFSVISKKN